MARQRERQEQHDAVKERERFLRTILDTALDGFWVVDGAAKLVDVNPAYCAMSGYSREELLEMHIADLDAAESPEETAAHVQRIRGEGGGRFETIHRRKDGSTMNVAASVTFIGMGRGLMVCFLDDITEQKRAVDALRESEQRFRDVVASAGEYVFEMDVQGILTYVSEAVEAILGYRPEEIVGQSSLRLLGPEEQARSAAYLGERVSRREKISHFQQQAIHRNGRTVWLEISATPMFSADGAFLGYRGAGLDVTAATRAEVERKAQQPQLAVSSRLEAMGTLVAGVAHEINNPLAGGMACQALAAQESQKIAAILRGGDPLDRPALTRSVEGVIELLGRAEADGMNISRIVKDLSAFGRPDTKRAPVRLSAVVSSAMRWLRVSVGDGATIRLVLEETPEVVASAGQLEQVVVNLVTNAANAIPEGRRGEITIRTGPGTEGMVRLEVSDNGPGIPPELREKIFEPFFTTRTEGTGTGLGLSICHVIVTDHGGTITVESEAGKGSTFRVELPAVAAAD